MCLRDANHDYRAPGSYMITLSMSSVFTSALCRVFDASGGVDFRLGRGAIAPSVKRIILFPCYALPFAACNGASSPHASWAGHFGRLSRCLTISILSLR